MARGASWILGFGLVALLAGCEGSSGPKQMYEGASLPASEVSVLELGDTLDLVRVDDRDHSAMISMGAQRFALLPGERRVEVRFYYVFQTEGGDEEAVRSPAYHLLLKLEAGGNYRVQAEKFTDAGTAKRAMSDLELFLVDLDSGDIRKLAVQDKVKAEREKAETLTVVAGTAATATAASNEAPESAAGTVAASNTSTDASAATATAAAGATAAAATATAGNRDPLQEIKNIWNGASSDERATIRAWIAEQP